MINPLVTGSISGREGLYKLVGMFPIFNWFFESPNTNSARGKKSCFMIVCIRLINKIITQNVDKKTAVYKRAYLGINDLIEE